MDRTLTVTEARALLPAILDLVEAGDEVTITRYGRPIAVVVQPGSARRHRGDAALAMGKDIGQRLTKARRSPRPTAGLSQRYAEELIAHVRKDRAGT